MQDIVYVSIVLVFFALTARRVAGCDRVVGSDDEALADPVGDEDVAASTRNAA